MLANNPLQRTALSNERHPGNREILRVLASMHRERGDQRSQNGTPGAFRRKRLDRSSQRARDRK